MDDVEQGYWNSDTLIIEARPIEIQATSTN